MSVTVEEECRSIDTRMIVDCKDIAVVFNYIKIHRQLEHGSKVLFTDEQLQQKNDSRGGFPPSVEPLLCTFRRIIVRMTYQRAGGGI